MAETEVQLTLRLARLPPYVALGEPDLLFSATNPKAIDPHPLRGLKAFGPYTGQAVKVYTPRLRVATIGPAIGRPKVAELMSSLREKHKPRDRPDYVPEFPGFETLLGVPLVAAKGASLHITWPDNLRDLPDAATPQERIAVAMDAALRALAAVRNEFDVAVVHLPDAWAEGLRGRGFDAHDTLKAIAASHGIPTQVLNDRAFTFPYRTSLAWRLSISLYVKAGGIPWKLVPVPGVPEGTAYIGLAYALRGDPREAHFITCCSQVFDADGGGMQFVAFEARDPVQDVDAARRNPFLSRSDMRAVLARSLSLYQGRNGGTLPRRVVIHKTTAFLDDELKGVNDALTSIPEVECIEVTTNVGWRGVWLQRGRSENEKSRPDGYPVPRGTMLYRSGTSAVVWVAGNAPDISTKGNYYQGGKSIPRPIVLTRHAGAGSLELCATEALALTKMDWNNDALYDPAPVTIHYSQRLARTIANVPWLPGKAYPYRMFM